MLRGRTTCTGLEEATTGNQWDHRKHLGACAELQDWEEVGEVVAEDVAGHRDCVFPFSNTLEGKSCGISGRQNTNVEATGVMIGEVDPDLGNQLGVVRTCFIEPEHRRVPSCSSSSDG